MRYGLARYEHAADAHHDHLICENCGRNIEVVDSQIEELQDALARKHGFKFFFEYLGRLKKPVFADVFR